MTYSRIFGIIIYQFSYEQEYSMVVSFIIEHGLKVNFYYSILSFGLAICLYLKRNINLLFYAQKII